jgi:hypothetical protein
MSQFQVKYSDKEDWKEIAEKDVLVKLADEFDQVTPIINQMVQGRKIITTDGIFRMKDHGREGKGIFLNIAI